MWTMIFQTRISGYLAAVIGIIAVTATLKLAGGRVNATTVALSLLLVVLFVAAGWGSKPAVLSSVLGVLCLNFFYLPPVGRWTIDDPDNWIALGVFLITAVTAGQLWARAKRRAEEADAGRIQIETLYAQLQDAFERSSQAKAFEQSERLKSALLDAVTHDLRTPLTSIKASVTTLLEEPPSIKGNDDEYALDEEGRREMLEVIDEETDRLNRFIEGLMELARIEAGEMHLRKRWGSVEEIVTRALERAAPLTRNHTVEVNLDLRLPAVEVDDRAVAEVVYTLIDNAAKYSPPGSCINISADQEGLDKIRLSVTDEGRGIPADLRERVFDKFFRAMRDGDTGGEQPSGSGMGLAIAKGIVEAHGGQVRIEDKPDRRPGSRVVVILPVRVDKPELQVMAEDGRQAAHINR